MIKTILPFLYFNGNCQEALDFYSTVFKVPILERVTYREAEMEVDAHQKKLYYECHYGLWRHDHICHRCGGQPSLDQGEYHFNLAGNRIRRSD